MHLWWHTEHFNWWLQLLFISKWLKLLFQTQFLPWGPWDQIPQKSRILWNFDSTPWWSGCSLWCPGVPEASSRSLWWCLLTEWAIRVLRMQTIFPYFHVLRISWKLAWSRGLACRWSTWPTAWSSRPRSWRPKTFSIRNGSPLAWRSPKAALEMDHCRRSVSAKGSKVFWVWVSCSCSLFVFSQQTREQVFGHFLWVAFGQVKRRFLAQFM